MLSIAALAAPCSPFLWYILHEFQIFKTIYGEVLQGPLTCAAHKLLKSTKAFKKIDTLMVHRILIFSEKQKLYVQSHTETLFDHTIERSILILTDVLSIANSKAPACNANIAALLSSVSENPYFYVRTNLQRFLLAIKTLVLSSPTFEILCSYK